MPFASRQTSRSRRCFIRTLCWHPVGPSTRRIFSAAPRSSTTNQPVGTGPYRFQSYPKDDVIRMEPHLPTGVAQATPALV